MNRKLLVSLCLFSILTSCSSFKSKLPNDEKYLYKSEKYYLDFALQTKDFYVYSGSIIKENNRYYFVDTACTFHCSVFEDTRIYKNNNFSSYSSNYEGIEEEKDCKIWVSCNISYSGEHSHHNEDRRMTFGDVYSKDFQGIGFYDHVLDIYYDCDKADIEKHDLDVTREQYPNVF